MSDTKDGRDADRGVVIGRSGVLTGYVLLLVEVAFIAFAATSGLSAALGYPMLMTGATAWLLFVRGGDEVRLAADALVVKSRGQQIRYVWSEVLEVAWRKQGTFLVGPGPVLRVSGGAFDEPGPNMPAQVASLAIFSRRANAAAEDALRSAACRRGVRFDPNMERDIALGKRRPQDPERRMNS